MVEIRVKFNKIMVIGRKEHTAQVEKMLNDMGIPTQGLFKGFEIDCTVLDSIHMGSIARFIIMNIYDKPRVERKDEEGKKENIVVVGDVS